MDTADVLFIASDPREFAGLVSRWTDVRPLALPVHWSRAGIWRGRQVIAIANGIGKDRARQAAAVARCRVLCNIGICGALDPKLEIGDVVVATNIDGFNLPQPRTALPHTTGPIASVDRVAGTVEEKARLYAQGAIAVEMEAGGLTGRPFYCIKSVSDTARDSFSNDFDSARLPDGRFSTARLLWSAMKRPVERVPELLRVARHSHLASLKLGEFLASCEF